MRHYVALPRDFYLRETVEVAKELLGKSLVRHLREHVYLEGRIVEVEAYRGRDDPASHAYRGLTDRNKIMFGKVGLAYIYVIYGFHYCLNVSARERSEEAGAVLLRAIEPIEGTSHMLRNRELEDDPQSIKRMKQGMPPVQITNGPGKLTKAMKITRKLNGEDFTNDASEIFICNQPREDAKLEICSTPRIGVNKGKDKLWRFCVKNSAFISRPSG